MKKKYKIYLSCVVIMIAVITVCVFAKLHSKIENSADLGIDYRSDGVKVVYDPLQSYSVCDKTIYAHAAFFENKDIIESLFSSINHEQIKNGPTCKWFKAFRDQMTDNKIVAEINIGRLYFDELTNRREISIIPYDFPYPTTTDKDRYFIIYYPDTMKFEMDGPYEPSSPF